MVDYRAKVRQWFKQYVVKCPTISSELRFILTKERHPNLETFFNNMHVELNKVQALRLKKGKKLATNEQLIWLVEAMAEVFVNNMEMKAAKMYQTESEKLARQKEEQKKFEFDETLAGRPTGEFAEAGVIVNAESEKQREII